MRAAAFLVVAGATLGVIEGAIRLMDAVLDLPLPALARTINARMALNPYQMPSPTHVRHWLLQAGWHAQSVDVAKMKRADGRIEGERAIDAARRSGYDLPLRINDAGFKGPDLDDSHSRPRLLVIGDSVTFGIAGWDFPRAIASSAPHVEVINGGVEGYSVRNALLRLPDYRAVKPQLCLIMIGWNNLYAESAPGHLRTLGEARRIVRMVGNGLGNGGIDADRALRQRQKHFDPDDPRVGQFRAARPAFVDDVEKLGESLESAGCKIAIATLAGLYVEGVAPSAKALEIGHLPAFTDNPAMLAASTTAANDGLRDLAKRRGWHIADVAAWADRQLHPRDRWFSDGVHFWAEGLTELGQFLAEDLSGTF